jgi:hypothetical protein
MNKTYRLYSVGMVNDVPICSLIAETQATDIIAAETALLAGIPNNGVEYLILVVK